MKDIKQVLKERPNVNDYDLKPYGYIIALTNYTDKLEEAINYSQCCKSVKEKYTHTFEVNLNSEKMKEQYNKQIEQLHNAPCKIYFYDGENYIELKP